MTNQAFECTPIGAAHGNENDTKDAGFVIVVGLVALLFFVTFACGALFTSWYLGGCHKKLATEPSEDMPLAPPLEIGYVTTYGKYIHLSKTCPWLRNATTEKQIPVCPKCLNLVSITAPEAQKSFLPTHE